MAGEGDVVVLPAEDRIWGHPWARNPAQEELPAPQGPGSPARPLSPARAIVQAGALQHVWPASPLSRGA